MANRRSGYDPHRLTHARKIFEKIVDHSRTSNSHNNLFQDISNSFGLALVNVKKGGVFMAGEVGRGIFIGRFKVNGINQWTGPIFLNLYGGEIGFSVGISNSDYLLIFNNEESLQKFLKENEFKLSIDAGVETVTEEGSKFKKGVIIHTVSSKGLFIGASLEGNIIKIDNKKTKKYYKKKFSIENIISGKIVPPKNADYQKIIELLNKFISNITLPQNFEPRKLSFENEFVDDAHNELPQKNGSFSSIEFSSQLSNIPRDSATYESQESKENEDDDFKTQDEESQETKQDLKFANEVEIMSLNSNENNTPTLPNLALKKDQDAITKHPSNELPLPEQTVTNNVLADENFKNKISDNPLANPLGNQQVSNTERTDLILNNENLNQKLPTHEPNDVLNQNNQQVLTSLKEVEPSPINNISLKNLAPPLNTEPSSLEPKISMHAERQFIDQPEGDVSWQTEKVFLETPTLPEDKKEKSKKNKILPEDEDTKESTLKDTSPRHTNNAREIEQSEELGITDAIMSTFFSIVGGVSDENKAVEKSPLETAKKESFTETISNEPKIETTNNTIKNSTVSPKPVEESRDKQIIPTPQIEMSNQSVKNVDKQIVTPGSSITTSYDKEAKILVKDSSSQKNTKNIANSSSINESEESDHENLPTLAQKPKRFTNVITNKNQNPPYQSLLASEPKNKPLRNIEEKSLLTNQCKKSKKIGDKAKRFLLCFACLCPDSSSRESKKSKNSTELGMQKSIHEFNKIYNFNDNKNYDPDHFENNLR